jgi:cytochrome c oxidase subunit 2
MPIVVEAISNDKYILWLEEKKKEQKALAAAGDREWTKDELMVQGQKVYSSTCASCHGVTGQGIPGVFPAISGSPIASGDINAHINIVMDGKAGTAMQAFGKQLSDSDLAAVITYERNALNNSSGDLVQPSTIKSAR